MSLANQSTHVELDLGCTRSIGSRTAIERFEERAWNSSVVMSLSYLPPPKQKPCKESWIIHFPAIPPCFTKVETFESYVHICVDFFKS